MFFFVFLFCKLVLATCRLWLGLSFQVLEMLVQQFPQKNRLSPRPWSRAVQLLLSETLS